MEPTKLYGEFAFAWTLSGLTVIRARSATEAQVKFEAMSRATLLNRSWPSFHYVAIEPHPGNGQHGR